jgi:glyoxylase-like metal-dependent hydrolase (beta-lactamase superfamily II)
LIIESIPVGPLKANCYLLGCEDTREGVIIDAGGDAERILERVSLHRLTVKHLLNTHGHFDHVGANRAVRDATGGELLIHGKDAFFLPRAAHSGAQWGVQTESSPDPDGLLEDGMTVRFGGCLLQVIHTPGHSPGGCSLYCEREGVVFTGDTLFNGSIGRSDFAGGDHAELIRSIRERLFTLPDATRVYPGHGPATTIGNERLHNPHVTRG